MSEQLKYQLKRVALLAVLAALGVVASNLGNLNIPTEYAFIVAAVVAALIQIVQGIVDTQRAAKGDIQVQDVGYQQLQDLEQHMGELQDQADTHKAAYRNMYERNRDLSESLADSEYRLHKFQQGEIPTVKSPVVPAASA